MIDVPYKLHPDAYDLPGYAHDGDAGMDLHARYETFIPAGERKLVPTGLYLSIPTGFVGLIHPRSGLALKYGVTVLNAPGTIDAGYEGEIGVILHNTSPVAHTVQYGDRIAQIVFQAVEYARLMKGYQWGDTARGSGGYGSTGD